MKHAVVTFICVFVLLSIFGCGEEGLIDPHGEMDIPPPPSTGFQAVDFPTDNGSAWTYANVGTGEEFTLRIEGIRDINGITHRQMTVSELSPAQPDSINREAVDHLSANRFYFGFGVRIAIPIVATYFLKTTQSYLESAYDIILRSEDVLHIKHSFPRSIWDFPLQVGKEWTVFDKTTSPSGKAVRRVIQANVSVRVPAGDYDAYLVEEAIVGLSEVEAVRLSADATSLEPARYEPAKYWVVPAVGVVKYEYTFLEERTAGSGEVVNLLGSATFELINSELPGVNSR